MAMSSGGTAEGEPMMEMNMTPLIDVLLVLIIMFIITIPIQTHAVKLDLPQSQPENTPPPIDPVKNKITVTPGSEIQWNGTPVNLVTLRQYLDLTKNMNPEPELHLEPDAQARYDTVDQVMAVVKKAQVTKFGFVGNEKYAAF